MNAKILTDFQICISVHSSRYKLNHDGAYSFTLEKNIYKKLEGIRLRIGSTEAVVRRCSVKKLSLEFRIIHRSETSFLQKVAGRRLRFFPVNFAKF